MIYVNFRHNQIKHVGEGLLDHLEELISVQFNGNVCIDKGTTNSSQIPGFIEILRQNCPDIEPETTTLISTSNQPPRCEIDDLEDFVCGLDEEVKNLFEENQKMKENFENQINALNGQVEGLKADNEVIKNQVEDLNSRNEALEENVEILNDQNQEMKQKLENQSKILLELERMVIELYSRPCQC
jgi:hypothetical protein